LQCDYATVDGLKCYKKKNSCNFTALKNVQTNKFCGFTTHGDCVKLTDMSLQCKSAGTFPSVYFQYNQNINGVIPADYFNTGYHPNP